MLENIFKFVDYVKKQVLQDKDLEEFNRIELIQKLSSVSPLGLFEETLELKQIMGVQFRGKFLGKVLESFVWVSFF